MDIQTYPAGQAPDDMIRPENTPLPPSPPSPAPVPPAPPAAPLPVQPVRPPRRVGTFTLGLTLVILGVFVPLALYFGGNAWKLLQFAPVVLLCLGVEILIYAIRFKTEKFRYDGLSIFMVVLITFVTLIGSLIGPPIDHAASYAERLAAERNKAVHTIESAMADARCTGNAYANDYEETRIWTSMNRDVDDIADWPVTVSANLYTVDNTQTPSKEQIAAAFAAIATSCGENGGIRELRLRIQVEEPDAHTEYSVRIAGNPIRPVSTDDMAARLIIRSEPNATTPSTTPATTSGTESSAATEA